MRRARRFIAVMFALLLLGTVALVLTVRTQWFRDYVRKTIISYTESATGGKVDLGSFQFDWTGMRASISDFVIHGTEGPGQAPLLRADRADLVLRLLPSFRHAYELESLQVESPQAHVVVYPDGRTNVPSPKIKHTSNTTVLRDVVDLAIRRFEIRNGVLDFNDQKIKFHARGENLVTQLSFNMVKQAYDGQVSIDPLMVQQIALNVMLPLHLERDRVDVTLARLATRKSELSGSASLQHLIDPQVSANLQARLSLAEVNQIAGLKLDLRGKNVPQMLLAKVSLAGNKLSSANVELGQSSIQASVNGHLEGKLALPQLGKLLAQPALAQAGTATLSSNIDLSGNVIRAGDLYITVLGGSFAGSASLSHMRQYKSAGNLAGFDIDRLARVFTGNKIGYAGVISGSVEVRGDFESKPAVMARANLTIQPGRNAVPVSGKLNVDSNGRVGDSYITLPASRLDLSGSINKQIHFKLASHDLDDFQPLLFSQPPPATLAPGGMATFEGDLTSILTTPQLSGHLTANRFVLENRPFDQLNADLVANSSHAAAENGTVVRGALQAEFSASVGLRAWKAEAAQPLSVTAQVRNADLADVLALAGYKNAVFTGVLNSTVQINGTVGNPQGSATLSVSNGTAYNYRFDRLDANVTLADQLVTLSNAQLTAGSAQAIVTGTYRHPQDSFSTGQIDAKIASIHMPLDQFRPVNRNTPPLAGTAQVNATFSANLSQSGLRITSVNGIAEARGLRYNGEDLGDLQAAAKTSGNNVDLTVNGAPFGSSIRVSGQTRLTTDYPTTASMTIAGLPLERAAALAGRQDLPVAGKLTADAKLDGPLSNPSGRATFNLSNATLYEHLDSLQGQLTYSNDELLLQSLHAAAGTARVDLSGSFTHSPGDFREGQLHFALKSNDVQLAQLKKVQEFKPGLAGTLKLDASGEGRLQKGEPALLLTTLNANIAANGLSLNKQPFGDATLTAETRGQDLEFKLRSNFAHADIASDGSVQLTGDYQAKANLTFSNVTYAGLRGWLPFSDSLSLRRADLNGVMEGSASISGPALKPEELTASLRIPKLQLAATPRASIAPKMSKMTLENDGPIALSLNRSVVRVDSAHIIGPHTDLRITGSAALRPIQALDLQANGTLDMGVLQSLDRDLYSSGSITLAAKISGTLDDPNVNGQLVLKSASLNLIDAPNGISKATGTILFNGKSAVIQSLTAESGGGSISLGGNATYAAGNANFRVTATAKNVRVRYPESVSTLADASLILNGNLDRSTLSGTVTVQRIGFNPHSDFGSVLSSAARPIQSPASPDPLLASVHLQIQVKTTPGIQFQTALAQNVQATADLRVRGTLDEPGVLGRINITQGELIFFGAKYTVNQGSVAFYDPARISPVLDVDLETKVQGVDITLTVSGPADNLTLTHRSDPPLPFDQVLALLAAGTTPTDPTIAARQPLAPPQSGEQIGESAILSQVVASPITDRLSRVFGITQLKIAPAFVTGSVLPQARVTLSQQVARNVNFTYITDVTNSNTQIFQVEWSIGEKWSAVATRDENGLFGIDFYYKRKFK
ncbi:MAG TPA: translocation/assembly module TamB domain-containing protein [Bryobacteraceae bacterium]|nr:translocation/assembly module TamB domain-containing protein [Bryobacteraceae bacterium]